MPVIRVVADDLTGALDSAAPFAAAFGGMEVLWTRPEKLAGFGSLALDTETRDIAAASAGPRVREWASFFKGADIAFKKLDSVLRGPVSAEIAGVWATGIFRSAVIAPAFPKQGRVTRAGRQHVRELDGKWRALPVDIAGELRSLGAGVELAAKAEQIRGGGVWLCDAETDADLAAIVAVRSKLAAPVLWVGSAGLARALADYPEARPPESWDLPWLGFVGTRHELTRRQIDKLEESRPGCVVPMTDLEDGAQRVLQRVARDLGRGEGRLLHLRLTPGQSRSAVLAALDRFATLVVANLPRPGTVIASGGETVMRFCSAEEAKSLVVVGEYAPGIPLAELMHGIWSGVRVVSKSGGFGDEDFLVNLVRTIEGGIEVTDRVRLVITMGDPAGVGPEIILKALKRLADREDAEALDLCVSGCKTLISDAAKHLGCTVDLVDFPARSRWPTVAVAESTGQEAPVPLGEVSAEGGRQAYCAIANAVELALEGKADAIVTAPLNKAALHRAGYKYPGHTELLAELTGTRGTVLMLAHGDFRVSHVTAHVALEKVPALVTRERVSRVIDLTLDALRRLGIENPRIGVAGLNPHAGEGGIFGRQEIEILEPLLEGYRARGMRVDGPVPGDVVFVKLKGGSYDAVVAMYHDQGHVPTKLLGFTVDRASGAFSALSGVNITLGLPIIRTSVDHGTAFDIAGKGVADCTSMIEAIDYAAQLVRGGRKTGSAS